MYKIIYFAKILVLRNNAKRNFALFLISQNSRNSAKQFLFRIIFVFRENKKIDEIDNPRACTRTRTWTSRSSVATVFAVSFQPFRNKGWLLNIRFDISVQDLPDGRLGFIPNERRPITPAVLTQWTAAHDTCCSYQMNGGLWHLLFLPNEWRPAVLPKWTAAYDTCCFYQMNGSLWHLLFLPNERRPMTHAVLTKWTAACCSSLMNGSLWHLLLCPNERWPVTPAVLTNWTAAYETCCSYQMNGGLWHLLFLLN